MPKNGNTPRNEKQRQAADAVTIGEVPDKHKRPGLSVGKPQKIITSAMRSKSAVCSPGGGGGGGGGGGYGGTSSGSGGNFYSPELSTDFLELPQSLDEQRNFFRWFYQSDPFVGQAIDLHTELPLSKVRLGIPKAQNRELAEKSLRFCQKWARRIGLLQRLISIVHDYYLVGEVFIFVEDTNPEMPHDIREEIYREIGDDGEIIEEWNERSDADERATAWVKKNYKGWTAIRTLPPEQIHMESFSFTDERIMELIPDAKSKDIVAQAAMQDPQALRIADSMPVEVVEAIQEGENIPLSIDPEAGSFCHYMARKKSDYEPRGHSILERCILPGTPVWVKREGVIQQVLIENVDVATDTLLTHKGRFRQAERGLRVVDEEIVLVYSEGSKQPLKLTHDHRVLVILEDGTEKWMFACDLQKGNRLRETHIVPEQDPLLEIDLSKWWESQSFQVNRRYRENQKGFENRTRQITVNGVGLFDDCYTITFKYAQDDAGRIEAVSKTEKLLGWLKSLKEPTEASYKKLGGLLGLRKAELATATVRLKEAFKIKTEIAENRSTIWYPVSGNVQVPGKFEYHTEESIVRSVKVNEDFCYLLGTWLGDGDAWMSDEIFLNVHSLGWTFGKESVELQNKVTCLIFEVFGDVDISGSLYGESADTTANHLRINDPLLAKWFVDTFGHGAQGKHLPEWVFTLPEGHILALLRGLLDTDGSIHVGRNTQIDFQLKSKVLIDQMHLLCNRVGLHTNVGVIRRSPSVWDRSWKTKNGTQTKTQTKTYQYGERTYCRLTCSRWPDVQRWAMGSIKGSQTEIPDRKFERTTKFKQGWHTRLVLEVLRIPYFGAVFSFDVKEDESLIAGGVVVHNCIRTLVYRDKLRQAQTSIASRHMTPMRLVWAEDADLQDVEDLREQVDMALQDPDYSIITNFQVNWEELGANDRLLDLSGEYELTDRQLYAGLGVTESLLSGESSYSGDRINLEVINTRYMLLRELIQEFVEEWLLRPMCARMGFIEEDEDGEDVVIYPTLSFTRLALRDNADTFDALFNLYQKGSLDIDVILELLNIDPVSTREKLERDMMTVNDATFNEVLRGLYSRAGDALSEKSNATEKIAEYLGLEYAEPEEEGGRY